MASSPNDLTIVSYNIGLGGKYLKKIKSNFSVHPGLKRADIVCLQEASFSGGLLDARVIANTLGSAYEFTNIEAQKVFGYMQANAVIYNKARLDLISSEVFELPTLPTFMYFLYLPLIGKAKFDRRICLIQDYIFKNKKVRIYNTHLDVRGGWRLKEEQINFIFEKIDSLDPVDLEVICGDLNIVNIVPEKYSNKERFLKLIKYQLKRRNFEDVSENVKWTFCLKDINPRHRFYEILRLLKKLGIRLDIKRKTDFVFARADRLFFQVYPTVALEIDGSDHLPLVFRVETRQ